MLVCKHECECTARSRSWLHVSVVLLVWFPPIRAISHPPESPRLQAQQPRVKEDDADKNVPSPTSQ
jgi:hypothetical protein